MLRPELFDERRETVTAAGGEPDVTAFLGKGLGGSGADALGGAGDENALAAQMKVHGNSRWLGGDRIVGRVSHAVNLAPQRCASLRFGSFRRLKTSAG